MDASARVAHARFRHCICLKLLGLHIVVSLPAKSGLYMIDSNAGFCRQSVTSMIWWNPWKPCSSAPAWLKGPDQIDQLLRETAAAVYC